MKRALIAIAVAGCHRTNDLELQLGPKPDQLSQGFQCKDPSDPSSYLFQRAITVSGTTYTMQYSLLVDVIHLRGVVPSCAGEDIVAACPDATACPTDADRVCLDFGPITFDHLPNKDEVTARIISEFDAHRGALYDNAPDGPVFVRVIAFVHDRCTAGIPAFATDNVVGCAFSCPEVLDDISGTLTVQLQLLTPLATTDACDAAIVACAQFPDIAN